MTMPYLAAALVLLGFFGALLLQIAIATKSLRRSWYLSLVYLAVSAGLVILLFSQQLDDRGRRDRLMTALAMPAGSPVQINKTTKLMEVSPSGSSLVYIYEVTDNAVLPSQAEAIAQNCQLSDLRAILELDAVILHRFGAKDGTYQELKVSRAQCG